MFAAPIEGILKNFMEFAETSFAGHEQAPPHQRTHSAVHDAKLIDRKGRYGRFRHVNAYPNPFLSHSSLSDCNLWIRSNSGYSGTCTEMVWMLLTTLVK